MTHRPSIAIVGGGTAGWIAAAALARAFDGRGNITIVEIPQATAIDMGEASLPTIRAFNERLGIAEDDFLHKTQATFKLGTEFTDWAGPGTSFFHPFGQYGTGIGTVGFHHCWFKLRQLGDKTGLAEYSLAAVAASLGRFARPAADAKSVLSSFSYGFHFDAALYAAELRQIALAGGVTHKQSVGVDAVLRSDDGFIDRLVLDRAEELRADLYLDCSGAFGLLIERALRTGYEDWSEWLPCDRAVACHAIKERAPRPLTQAMARAAGWQWRIPMQHRTSHGHVYASRFSDDWEARKTLLDNLDSPSEPTLVHFTNGRRRKFWNKNCVALGAAGGFLEPLESTSVHLIQSGISRLLKLLPGEIIEPALADEYNRLTIAEFEHIRDFLILHYHANRRAGSPLWDYCRNMAIPDSLATKIALFKSRGRIPPHGGEIFFLPSWLSVFTGLDVQPRRYHPFADGLDLEDMKRQMQLIRTAIRRAAETLPGHGAFLAQSMAGGS
jgi:tryptophan 7-halogenase